DVADHASPVAVSISKKLLWESWTLDPSESERREAVLSAWLFEQPDAREGVAAFLEKRSPNWPMRVSIDGPAWPS
ncbi:MAG TPA: hypothetical protein VFK41_00605, partial [Nocardioidaceae bacterium]|nr:hypothetical protein [Nocardioidaceae bacterium]